MEQSKKLSSGQLDKKSLELVRHAEFFKKLDKSSQELRRQANEIANFLVPLKNKTPEMHSLIKTFQSFPSIPINLLDEEINRIKDYYVKFESDKAQKLSLSGEDLFVLLEKQNCFNQEANKLLLRAIDLYESEKRST